MLFIPWFRQIPVGFSYTWKDVKKKNKKDILVVIMWFFDKVGFLLECTPLYFLSCGFWIDYYIPRGRKVIQKYKDGYYSKKECEHLLKYIDIKLYTFWLIVFSPLIFVAFVLLASYIMDKHLIIKILSVIIFSLTVHEFACPSSVKRWRAAINTGDQELAKIINIAGPSCLRYFHNNIITKDRSV